MLSLDLSFALPAESSFLAARLAGHMHDLWAWKKTETQPTDRECSTAIKSENTPKSLSEAL